MLRFVVQGFIVGDAAAVWRAWAPTFPVRPPEEEARNEHLYPLAYGLRIPVTLVVVNELRNWTVQHGLPAGKVTIDHWIGAAAQGGVHIGQTYEVVGPMSLVYRLLAPGIRASARSSWTDLARRVAAR